MVMRKGEFFSDFILRHFNDLKVWPQVHDTRVKANMGIGILRNGTEQEKIVHK